MFVVVSSTTGDAAPDAGCGNGCDWLSAVWLQHRRHQCSSEREWEHEEAGWAFIELEHGL